jgi:hypothetical protein
MNPKPGAGKSKGQLSQLSALRKTGVSVSGLVGPRQGPGNGLGEACGCKTTNICYRIVAKPGFDAGRYPGYPVNAGELSH